MPEVRREGVFETNSSSTHSICISPGDFKPDRIPVDENGVCRIWPGEFGWGYDRFTDAPTKASYAYVYAQDDEELMRRLESVIRQATGAREVVFCRDAGEFYPSGYIDHQSDRGDRDVGAAAFENDERLHRFIFSPRSELVIDNDNH